MIEPSSVPVCVQEKIREKKKREKNVYILPSYGVVDCRMYIAYKLSLLI